MNGKVFRNGHGFFEMVSELFGRSPSRQTRKDEDVKSEPVSEIETAFNAALQQLNNKIELLREAQLQVEAGPDRLSATQLAAEREKRMQQVHDQVFGDVLEMHHQLATGIDRATLKELAEFVKECREKVVEGYVGTDIMACCLSSVLRRLHREAGVAAWAELEGLLAARGTLWPETTRRDPVESEVQFRYRHQEKYQETRSSFVNYDPQRSSDLIFGVERAWHSDYPEPGSPLWRELVLEAVATGLRARILKGYYERLVARKDEVRAEAAELVGRELQALKEVLADKTFNNLEDAHRVSVSSKRVMDEVIPEIAWKMICHLPGEAGTAQEKSPEA